MKVQNDLIKICESLINTRYKYWLLGDKIDYRPPFYYKTDFHENFNLKYIKDNGTNCAGFINIICSRLNKNQPNLDGGTEGWFFCLKKKKKLYKIDPNTKYPFGTLLLRNYANECDQGHLAIKYDNEILNKSKIIHCYSTNTPNRKLNQPGVIIEDFNISNNWFSPTYTHISYIEDWLACNLDSI